MLSPANEKYNFQWTLASQNLQLPESNEGYILIKWIVDTSKRI